MGASLGTFICVQEHMYVGAHIYACDVYAEPEVKPSFSPRNQHLDYEKWPLTDLESPK